MRSAARIISLWQRLVWVRENADPELAQRGRFFARLLVVALPFVAAIGMGLLPYWLRPTALTETPMFWLGFGCVVMMVGCFVVNRRGRYVVAAWAFVLASGFAMHLASLEEVALLHFFASLSLVAFALLPLRAAIVVSLGAPASGSLFVLTLSKWRLSDVVVPLCANVFISALLWVVQLHQRSLERGRLAELSARERWFSTTLNSIGDAVLTVDPAGNVTFLNAVAESLTGVSSAEALGGKASAVFRVEDPRTGKPAESPVAHALEKGAGVGPANHSTLLARDGCKRSIAERGAPIVDEQGVEHGVVLVFRDVSREQALELRVQHAQRFDALGRLAGGVAHDFNNLLTAIGGGTAFAREQLPKGHAAREELAVVLDATDRAVQLTSQLLAFSRRQVMRPNAVSLNAAVSAMVQILKRLLPEQVTILLALDPAAGWVEVDPVQFEQVLVNLAVNGGDAMPGGGTLTLSTRQRSVSAEQAVAHLQPGNYGCLEVRDTGTGMDQATQDRAFEPFFSTKGADQGTGLGLATVYGIVHQSGGAVLVESRLGAGTVFSVLLPSVAPPAAAPPRENVAEATALPGAARRVFLVEDDPLVRRLVLKVLSLDGYRIQEAASGEEALALLAADAQTPDLLLTDIVMPGMSGIEVAAAFRQRLPRLRVLYMSGYANEILAREGVRDGQSAFLAKPFSPAELRAAVQHALKLDAADKLSP